MLIKIVRKNSQDDQKYKFLREIVEKLDDLYDDLSYELNEDELVCVKSKIALREKILEKLIQ